MALTPVSFALEKFAKLKTPFEAIAKKTSSVLNTIERGIGTVAVGLGVGGSPVVARAVKTGVQKAVSYAVEHPIKTVIGTGQAVIGATFGYNVLKQNPKLPEQTLGFVADVGTAVGKVTSGEETVVDAGKSLVDTAIEHPLLTTATVGTLAVAGYEVVKGLLPESKNGGMLGHDDVVNTPSPSSSEAIGGQNQAITDNSPGSMVQEEIKSSTHRKRRKKLIPSPSPAVRLTNKNYINIKNYQRVWR